MVRCARCGGWLLFGGIEASNKRKAALAFEEPLAAAAQAVVRDDKKMIKTFVYHTTCGSKPRAEFRTGVRNGIKFWRRWFHWGDVPNPLSFAGIKKMANEGRYIDCHWVAGGFLAGLNNC